MSNDHRSNQRLVGKKCDENSSCFLIHFVKASFHCVIPIVHLSIRNFFAFVCILYVKIKIVYIAREDLYEIKNQQVVKYEFSYFLLEEKCVKFFHKILSSDQLLISENIYLIEVGNI